MLTPEQIAERRHFIGASEVAAICGLNPYCGPLEVFMLKKLPFEQVMALSDKIGEKLCVEMGNALEPLALRKYERKYGVLPETGVVAVHPDVPFLRASLDGWDPIAKCPVEAKYGGSASAHNWGDDPDAIPMHYRVQLDIQIACKEALLGRLVGLIDGETKFYEVQRDDSLIKHWVEQVRHFKHVHLDRDDPPPPRNADEADLYLGERFKHARRGVFLEPTPEARAIAARLAEVKDRQKEIENERARYEVALKAMCGDAEGIAGICSWTPVNESVVHTYTRKSYRMFRLKGEAKK